MRVIALIIVFMLSFTASAGCCSLDEIGHELEQQVCSDSEQAFSQDCQDSHAHNCECSLSCNNRLLTKSSYIITLTSAAFELSYPEYIDHSRSSYTPQILQPPISFL